MIEHRTYYFPYVGEDRYLHIYLPDDYYRVDRDYPVMYMLDGHNLFFHRDATYGRSWGLKHYMDQADRQMIIVGIECSHTHRIQEYCPYYVGDGFGRGPIEGYGDRFMDWLVGDLKGYIDSEYRTQPFRETTGLGGSSMGGLMALYGLIAYNEYFSKAASLSPAISLCMGQLDGDLQRAEIDPDSRIFFSFGSRELDRYSDGLAHVGYFNDQIVARGGASYVHVQQGGGHTENTWRRQNSRYMEFLWD